VALFAPFRAVLYDRKVAGASERVAAAAERAARDELGRLRKLKGPQRTPGLESLRRRVAGLAVTAEVERALEESRKG
jgi:hypothetical protein